MNHNIYITDLQIILLFRPFPCPYWLEALVFTSSTWKLSLFRVLMWNAFLLAPHTLFKNLRGSVMRTIRSYIKKQDKRKLALYLNAHMAVSRYRIITQDQLSHFVQNTWKKKKRKTLLLPIAANFLYSGHEILFLIARVCNSESLLDVTWVQMSVRIKVLSSTTQGSSKGSGIKGLQEGGSGITALGSGITALGSGSASFFL